MTFFGYSLTGLGGGWLAGLAIAGAGALIALYFLRPRRHSVVVPFVDLWLPAAGQRSLDGLAHGKLARRLRGVASLLLQLAILGALLLAASEPRPAAGRAQGRSLVLLIDRSASMQALDETGSRMERARVLARELIAGLLPEDQAQVASFAADVSAATGMESDRARLVAAVDALTASDEPGNQAAALHFAAALLSGRSHPTLVVIGDGGGPDANAPDAALARAMKKVEVSFLQVGRRRNNLAIVGFSVRRSAADNSVDAVAITQNFRDRSAEVTLSVLVGPHRIPVGRRAVRLPPGARVITALTALAAPDAEMEVVLQEVGAPGDDLPLDDRAFAVAPTVPPLQVLVVGSENLFLEGALLGMSSAAWFERISGGDAASSRPRWPRYDVVIFDGVTPPAPQPTTGGFLYLDPHGAGSPWPARGVLADPVVTDVRRDHPLVKQLALADLNIAVARRLMLSAGDVVVAAAVNAPLVVARDGAELRQVGLAFDVRRSDLPLRSAFPLLLANCLAWLAQQPAPEVLSGPTGQTLKIDLRTARTAARTFRTVKIRAPDGRAWSSPVQDGWVTIPLDRVGVFTVSDDRPTAGAEAPPLSQIASNLASPLESDLEPRPVLKLGGREIDAVAPASVHRQAPPTRRELPVWLWAALAALVLSAGEWVSIHRPPGRLTA